MFGGFPFGGAPFAGTGEQEVTPPVDNMVPLFVFVAEARATEWTATKLPPEEVAEERVRSFNS